MKISKIPENKKSQTEESFKEKWENNAQLAFSETLDEKSDVFHWIMERNGFEGGEGLKKHLRSCRRILDAGCGNGRVTAMLHRYAPAGAQIVGIDLAAAHVAKRNLQEFSRIQIYKKDLLGDLEELGTFDFIYCQEVLHHTENPKAAFLNLSKRLSREGEIAIYVYKKKAPLREYADDFIRSKVSELPYDEAMISMRQLTEFARVLSEVSLKVNVPSVDILGIEAGEYELQRLIYHFCFKNFWNSSMTFEENAAVNFDWYHPQLSTRHTLEEVTDWFASAGLTIKHSYVDHYGITIRGVRH